MPRPPRATHHLALTTRQKRFVDAFVRLGIIAAAAKEAGYGGKHPQAAGIHGRRLLADARIASAVESGRKARAERLGVTLDFLLLESARIAASDIGRCFDDHGNALPIHEIDEDTRRAIMSIEVITKNAKTGDGQVDEVLKIRLWQKDRGLELAGKLSGHLVERRETGKPGDFRSLSIDEKRSRAEDLARKLLGRPQLVEKAS